MITLGKSPLLIIGKGQQDVEHHVRVRVKGRSLGQNSCNRSVVHACLRPASPSHLHSLPIVHCCRRRPLIDLGGACLASHSHGMAWQTDSISLLLNGEGSTGAPPFRPLYLFARTADVLRNVSHTIRTINNDYNGRYGRPIVWKERAREHATGPNQTKSCSSLLFPSLSLSVGVRTKIGSPPPPPFLSLPLAFRRRRAQRERCPNTKRNVIIHS